MLLRLTITVVRHCNQHSIIITILEWTNIDTPSIRGYIFDAFFSVPIHSTLKVGYKINHKPRKSDKTCECTLTAGFYPLKNTEMNSFLGKMKEKVVSLSMHVCYHVKLNIIYLNRLQQLKCCLLSAINLSAQCNKDFSTINLSAQCNKYFSAINLSAQCNKHFRDQGCSKPIPNQSQY